ncbi:MAG: hypothetical protein NZ742_08195, partial [Acidobacteria bacterium]|nr:hypothetical protein [Acidobacteriota bacterium]MDW7983933.1 hypothetical protein [Acidobacteriota bacterium]
MDRDRLAWWQQRVVQYMQDGMDPGLIAAVLFYHWMETLYMDDILQEELDPERIQAIGERLYVALRPTSVPPSPTGERPETSPPFPDLDALLRDGQTAIYEQIHRMYPRRILHQRDIDRWVQRLSDELDNTMVEVAQWAGRLDTWRPVVFALWWWFKLCLESVPRRPALVG